MTTTKNDLSSVLAHHGFDVLGKSDETVIDDMRAVGMIYACLGCGSVGQMRDDQWQAAGYASMEEARVATRDNYDFECCSDSETILF